MHRFFALLFKYSSGLKKINNASLKTLFIFGTYTAKAQDLRQTNCRLNPWGEEPMKLLNYSYFR